MKTITQTIDININNQLCIKDNLFFDIETHRLFQEPAVSAILSEFHSPTADTSQ